MSVSREPSAPDSRRDRPHDLLAEPGWLHPGPTARSGVSPSDPQRARTSTGAEPTSAVPPTSRAAEGHGTGERSGVGGPADRARRPPGTRALPGRTTRAAGRGPSAPAVCREKWR